MTDRIAITGRENIREGTAQNITAKFLTSGTPTAPTNVYWRLDGPDGCEIAGWTSATPGTTATIPTTSTHNTAQSCEPTETRLLTVAADYELSGQYIEFFEYTITNLPGIR